MTGAGWSATARHRLPILWESTCTGCGDCVRLCPMECLALGAFHPWLPRPADCVSCGLCVVVCSAQAIELADIIRNP
ncbi:MAG: 4Fe-4S binding protein [Bacteroidales bacterium]|nr:4Fe-4S binding protein [Bacteroidales bacterium]